MVAAEKIDVLGIFDLEGEQQADRLETLRESMGMRSCACVLVEGSNTYLDTKRYVYYVANCMRL